MGASGKGVQGQPRSHVHDGGRGLPKQVRQKLMHHVNRARQIDNYLPRDVGEFGVLQVELAQLARIALLISRLRDGDCAVTRAYSS